MKDTPPYRIHTERLVLRCYDPADAPLLKDAIDTSLEHLRPWMPWAMDEPQTVGQKVARLRRMRSQFDCDEQYVYGAFAPDESLLIGGCGLHPRVGPGGIEIGYWIRASHVNRGYATELSAALTRVAFEICGVDRVEIHCDPDNARSAAVPRKLGFAHEATLRRRVPDSDGVLRDSMMWVLFADRYPTSPSAAARIEAFDAMGTRVLPRS